MPTWFFILLGLIVVVAVVMAITMGFTRRGSAGGQNTTIVERTPSDPQNTTVVESD